MSFIAKRAALQATRAVRQPTLRRTYADALSSAEQAEKKNVLAKGARRDPELYVRTRPFSHQPSQYLCQRNKTNSDAPLPRFS